MGVSYICSVTVPFLNRGVCLWFTAATWLALLFHNLTPFFISLFAPEIFSPACFLSFYADSLTAELHKCQAATWIPKQKLPWNNTAPTKKHTCRGTWLTGLKRQVLVNDKCEVLIVALVDGSSYLHKKLFTFQNNSAKLAAWERKDVKSLKDEEDRRNTKSKAFSHFGICWHLLIGFKTGIFGEAAGKVEIINYFC